MRNLVRLASLLEEPSYAKKAQDTVHAFRLSLSKFPFAIPALVASFMLVTNGLKEVKGKKEDINDKCLLNFCKIVLSGNPDDFRMREFQRIVSRVFLPNKLVSLAKGEGFIAQKNSIIKQIGVHANPVAYICDNFSCGLPIHDANSLKKALSTDQ